MGYFTRNHGIIGRKTTSPGVSDARALKRGDGSIVGTDQVPTITTAPERWDILDEYLYDGIASWPIAYVFDPPTPVNGSYTQLENETKLFEIKTFAIPVGTKVWWVVVHDTTSASSFYNNQTSGSFFISASTVAKNSYTWNVSSFQITTSFTGNPLKGPGATASAVTYKIQLQMTDPAAGYTTTPYYSLSQTISIPAIIARILNTTVQLSEGYSSSVRLAITNMGTANSYFGTIKTSDTVSFSGASGPYANSNDFLHAYGTTSGFPTTIPLNPPADGISVNNGDSSSLYIVDLAPIVDNAGSGYLAGSGFLNSVNYSVLSDTVAEGSEWFLYAIYYNNICLHSTQPYGTFGAILINASSSGSVSTNSVASINVSISSPNILIQAGTAANNFTSVYGPSHSNTENTSVAVTITTSRYYDGTILFWRIQHGTTSAVDFAETSGRVTLYSGNASVQLITMPRYVTSGTTSSVRGNLGTRTYNIEVSPYFDFSQSVATDPYGSSITAPAISVYFTSDMSSIPSSGIAEGGWSGNLGIDFSLAVDISNFGTFYSNITADIYTFQGSSGTNTTPFTWVTPSNSTPLLLSTTVSAEDFALFPATITANNGNNRAIFQANWDPLLIEKSEFLQALVVARSSGIGGYATSESSLSGNYIALGKTSMISFTNYYATSTTLTKQYLNITDSLTWLQSGTSRSTSYSVGHESSFSFTEYNDDLYGYGSPGIIGANDTNAQPTYSFLMNNVSNRYIKYHNQGFVTFSSAEYSTDFGIQSAYISQSYPVSANPVLFLGAYGNPEGTGQSFATSGSGFLVDATIQSGSITSLVVQLAQGPGTGYLNGTSGTLTFTVNGSANPCIATIAVTYGVPNGTITIVSGGTGYTSTRLISAGVYGLYYLTTSVVSTSDTYGNQKATTTQTYLGGYKNENVYGIRIESRKTTENKNINAPEMVVEAYFWKPIADRSYLPVIEILIGTNTRIIDGTWGLAIGGKMIVNFSGNANTSYVLVGNATGTLWSVMQGYLLNAPY